MTFPDEKTYDDLVERLNRVRQVFAHYVHDGVRLTPVDCNALSEDLSELCDEAQAMVFELSAKRWNDRGRADPLMDVVFAEINRPGSNVELFPMLERPIPADAIQLSPGDGTGGAA